jgi:peptidyl-prolyl cis-trans isomerase SurA
MALVGTRSFVFRTLFVFISVALLWPASTVAAEKKKKSVPDKKPIPAKEEKKPGVNPNEVSARVGQDVITVRDLEQAFKKTSPSTLDFNTLNYDSLKTFTDLYVNYRLKLKHAGDIRLAIDPEVEKELDQNRKSFAGPYLIERLVTEPAVRLIYERRKEELHVQQIQVAFAPNRSGQPSPADTLRSYEKAKRLLALVKGGADFTKMSEDSSDEPTVKNTHGILRWLTGGETPRSFEDAVYGLKKGQICDEPVRTPYGFFVVRLLDRQKRSGAVQSWQILLQVSMSAPRMDTLKQYALADSLMQVLKHNRGNFDDLAKQFSQDKGTAEKSGDMGYRDRGDRALPKEYQEALFSIADNSLYPRVARSLYGYHIIRRGESRPIGAYDDEKENLKVLYKRYFFQDDYASFVQSLRKKYQFALNPTGMDLLLTHVDTTKTTADTMWDKNIAFENRAAEVYSLRGAVMTLGALVDTLKIRPDLRGTALNSAGITNLVNKQTEPLLIEYEAEHIEDRYPEFKTLMADVRDGILIYRLEQQEVWNKLQVQMTDSAVRAYWELRKAEFLTSARVDISEIYTVADTLAWAIYRRVKAGENFDTLAKLNTLRVGFKEKSGHWGWFNAQDNPLAAKVIEKDSGFVSEPFAYESGYSVVRVNAKDSPHEKTFRDAVPDVASKYQEYLSFKLMNDWIDSLKAKYPVQVNVDVLKRVATH